MLQVNLSHAETQRLNYERYHYPCTIIQKRIEAVFIKATTGFSGTMVGQITGLHRHSASRWAQCCQTGGFESLYQYNYGTNKSELENYPGSILNSFTQRPR